ncbi:hypothetical protein GF407_20375 [candidate division KSB1 bacterium]|nr:hypothetical protein [candidate division KSB1 bacterium]
MRSSRFLIFSVLLLFCSTPLFSQIILDETYLFYTPSQARTIKNLTAAEDEYSLSVLNHLSALADSVMTPGPWSVTFHKTGYDKHDYYSQSPYWWPDPADASAPYIRKDGQVNPAYFDQHHDDLHDMSEAVFVLGTAAYIFADSIYANRAAYILDTWFVDEETRMNPHLEHAQAIPNRSGGRHFGIIDTNPLILAVQGIVFLQKSGLWPYSRQEGVLAWFSDFQLWLSRSDKGKAEQRYGNNHSTWYTAQLAAYSILINDIEYQDRAWSWFRTFLLPKQLDADGSMPLEEERTKSLSYSLMNMDGLALIARMAQVQGHDLWRFKSGNKSLKTAVDALIPYIKSPQSWPLLQIKPVEPAQRPFLVWAAAGLDNRSYLDLYRALPARDSYYCLLSDLLAAVW